MKLTKLERLMLINQYEILKRSSKKPPKKKTDAEDEEDPKRYDRAIEILKCGYTSLYEELVDDIDVQDDMPIEECKFVQDVVAMYNVIVEFRKEHPNDKEVVEHLRSKWTSFSHNNEARYGNLARFIILEKWPSLAPYEKKPILNPARMKDTYLRMLEAYKPYKEIGTLTGEQIRKVLAAASLEEHQ